MAARSAKACISSSPVSTCCTIANTSSERLCSSTVPRLNMAQDMTEIRELGVCIRWHLHDRGDQTVCIPLQTVQICCHAVNICLAANLQCLLLQLCSAAGARSPLPWLPRASGCCAANIPACSDRVASGAERGLAASRADQHVLLRATNIDRHDRHDWRVWLQSVSDVTIPLALAATSRNATCCAITPRVFDCKTVVNTGLAITASQHAAGGRALCFGVHTASLKQFGEVAATSAV